MRPVNKPRLGQGDRAQRRGGWRGASAGASLFSRPRRRYFSAPRRAPAPRSPGTFPLAWRGMNQPRCAARRRHVVRGGGGRARAAVLTRRLLPSQAASRASAPPRTKGSPRRERAAHRPSLPSSMKKTEMGRFNISPDEDSSSYSSNSDFNYSYPTKQAALKRWEKEMCFAN